MKSSMLSNFLKDNILTKSNKKVSYYKNFNSFDATKETIIFNYGLVCSHEHFKHQIEFFSKTHNILAHNYRGHFNSESEVDFKDVNFENICSDIRQIYSKENLTQAHHIGHSMGVNVSLEFSKNYPHLVKSLTLIAGTAQPVFGTMFNSNIVEHLNPILKIIFNKYPNAVNNFWKHTKHNPLIKRIIHQGGFNIDTVSQEFINIYLEKINELGPHLFLRLLEEMNSHEALSFISQIKHKTLIIGGDNDKVIPNYNQRILHEKIQYSELFILRNGSHVPQIDFPDYINERISLFFKSLAKA